MPDKSSNVGLGTKGSHSTGTFVQMCEEAHTERNLPAGAAGDCEMLGALISKK